jgi:hypothetical protein
MTSGFEDQTAGLELLRDGMNDLISILAIRAAGVGQGQADTFATLLDVLVASPRLDFACGRWDGSIDGAPLELARLPRHSSATVRPEDICQALEPWLARDPPVGRGAVPEAASLDGDDSSGWPA